MPPTDDHGLDYNGTPIYTKGKITREGGEEIYYVLISAKTTRRE